MDFLNVKCDSRIKATFGDLLLEIARNFAGFGIFFGRDL